MPDPNTGLLIDDHEIVRMGLRQLLSRLPGAWQWREAASLEEALVQLRLGPVALMLVDLALGDDFALRSLGRLREAAPGARLVVLTSMSESLYGERALQAGADGFVMKSQAGEQLLDAVQCVLGGQIYLSPELREQMLRRLATGKRVAASGGVELSPREVEVLRLVAEGRSTREIAELLNRSVKTIETHKATLKTKLGAESPAQLIRLALAWFGEPA